MTLETQVEKIFESRPDLTVLRMLTRATCRKCHGQCASTKRRCSYCNLEFSVLTFKRSVVASGTAPA